MSDGCCMFSHRSSIVVVEKKNYLVPVFMWYHMDEVSQAKYPRTVLFVPP